MAHTYRDTPSAGTTLQISITAVYTTIPGATDISHEDYSRGIRTPTPLSATAVVNKPGMPKWGAIKSKVYYDPNDATHILIRDRLQLSAAAQGATLDSFKVIMADGFTTPANLMFDGFVSEFGWSATDPETGTVTADMTIQIVTLTGFTAGAPAE